MNPFIHRTLLLLLVSIRAMGGSVIFKTTSPYHHIKVVDRGHWRTLHFDNTNQSRMSLDNPLEGHCEYIEYFHMPWLWNDQIKSVLFIGLGGASIQRAYQVYWPHAQTETVELDPKVVEVAKKYFHFEETDNMKVIISDGRLHLRRTTKQYDLIVIDAYTANRYGAYIPYHIVTQEFFTLAHKRLSNQGLIAINVAENGLSVTTRKKGIDGAIYNTLKTSFPQVYLFPTENSGNVIMIAAKSPQRVTKIQLKDKLDAWTATSPVLFPNFLEGLKQFRSTPPVNADISGILTDDFAPVENLLRIK
jgi:spermidine synthase